MNTFVVLPDEIVGYTELKNSSEMFDGTNANSSRKMMLKEPPRIADPDVELARIFEPFSRSILPLFQIKIPCCNHFGICSYASCNLPRSSIAVDFLFARTATETFSLKGCNEEDMLE